MFNWWKSINDDRRFVALKLIACLCGFGFFFGTGSTGIAFAAAPQIVAGDMHSLSLDTDGRLLVWGSDSYGQLGLGSLTFSTSPISVPVAASQTKIVSGYMHVLSLDGSGKVWSWGGNSNGQLGDGSFVNRPQPRVVLADVIDIAAGSAHSMALKRDGSLWIWGFDSVTRTSLSLPIQINGTFHAISGGGFHNLALRNDGSVWAWGKNDAGQLGDGTKVDRALPVQVGTGYVAIEAGGLSSYGIKADGSLWAWGRNDVGQLGDGTRTDRQEPVLVGRDFKHVAASDAMTPGAFTMGIKQDGSLWSWGSSEYGKLGFSEPLAAHVLTPKLLGTGFATVSIGSAEGHVLAVKTDGTLWAWGANHQGQVGDGSNESRSQPVQIGTTYKAVSAGWKHSVAIKQDGGVWVWGANDFSQLGQQKPTVRSSPTYLGDGYAWVSTKFRTTLAIRNDGTLWAWGSNSSGQIGDGTIIDKASPVQIAGQYSKVFAGPDHSAAIKIDGTFWTWGIGWGVTGPDVGSLYTSPQKIANEFVDAALGDNHTLALKSDGSLWAWGLNQGGQLGLGNVSHASLPSFVGDGYTAIAAHAKYSAAIKSDGSLWVWGSNEFGQLGAATLNSMRPQRLLPGTERFVALAAGQYRLLAMREDGVVLMWSSSSVGPQQVFTGATKITTGHSHTLAMNGDGTVLAWGFNNAGQLGIGTFAYAGTPQYAINEKADEFLDLIQQGVNQVNDSIAPAFLVKAEKLGNLSDLTLKVEVRGPRGIQGTVTTPLRSTKLATNNQYNMYVAAYAGSGSFLNWYQLNADYNWSVLQWPMAQFLSNVALNSAADSIRFNILENANFSNLGGSRIYVGYGTSPDEMIGASRYREVMTVPSD